MRNSTKAILGLEALIGLWLGIAGANAATTPTGAIVSIDPMTGWLLGILLSVAILLLRRRSSSRLRSRFFSPE